MFLLFSFLLRRCCIRNSHQNIQDARIRISTYIYMRTIAHSLTLHSSLYSPLSPPPIPHPYSLPHPPHTRTPFYANPISPRCPSPHPRPPRTQTHTRILQFITPFPLPLAQTADVTLPEDIVALLAEEAPKKKNRSSKKSKKPAATATATTA